MRLPSTWHSVVQTDGISRTAFACRTRRRRAVAVLKKRAEARCKLQGCSIGKQVDNKERMYTLERTYILSCFLSANGLIFEHKNKKC